MSSNYERTVKTNTFDEDIKNYTIQDIYDLLNITSANPTDTQINMAIDTLSSKMKKEGNYDIVHFLSAARIKVIQELRDNQFHKTFAIQERDEVNQEHDEEDDEEDDEEGDEEGEQEGEEDNEEGKEEGEEEDVDVPIDEKYGNYNNMNNDFNEKYGIDESYRKNNDYILQNKGINAIYNTTKGSYEEDENAYGYINRDDEGNQDDIKETDDELFSDIKNGNFIPKKNLPTDINHTYELPFVKGTVNPLLATTVKRSIVVDSYYRQMPLDKNNSSFLFNLSHELKYVIGMQLYSIQIPTTWNNIDPLLGNSLIKIGTTTYAIPAGYYTSTSLFNALNTLVPNITFTLNNLSRIEVVNTTLFPVTITFYDPAGMTVFGITDINTTVNNNLGWTLGFRVPANPLLGTVSITLLPINGTFTGFQPDLSGSKYFTLGIDDFNNSHLNNFLVNSSSANSQNDIFAIIPLKDIHPPAPYVDYDSNLEIFKRTYFGPVNLSKLKITLYDDRGNIVNLNQQDWSFTLIVEQMYKN